MSNKHSIELLNISKKFLYQKSLFKDINLQIESGVVFGFFGANGRGKSTLLKIVAGVATPTSGNISYTINQSIVNKDLLYKHIGFVAPYLNLYEDLSATEMISLLVKLKSLDADYSKDVLYYVDKFKIYEHREKLIKNYSTGMKQRLKLSLAFGFNPKFIFLDEPSSNLDLEGKETLFGIIRASNLSEKVIIIATNDTEEKSLCHSHIDLDQM